MTKRILLFLAAILIFLPACTKNQDEPLAFFDETEETESQVTAEKTETETSGFSKDWNQGASYAFGFGGNRVYYLKGQSILQADPAEGTYHALCQKPDCSHDGEGCYAWLGDCVKYNENFQVYDDGIYQPVFIETDPENPILRYYRIDPSGTKPKSIACEIPMQGLFFVTESYQVYPDSKLHRDYAVISTSSQEEAEEPYDPKTEEDYDPENPFNEHVRESWFDVQNYVSVYHLETGEMTPVLNTGTKSCTSSYVSVIPYEDELFIFLEAYRMKPVKTANEDGTEEYGIDLLFDTPEIYRWKLGSSEEAQKIPVPELPFGDHPSFRIHQGKILMLGETKDGSGRRMQTLCMLDPDTGEVSQGKEICELRDDRICLANFGDGYLYMEDFRGNPYQSGEEMTGEDFTILDYNGEELYHFSFDERLPSDGYSRGVWKCGSDPEYLYCMNYSEEETMLYRIPVNGNPVEFFSFGNAFCQDSGHLYFSYDSGAYGQNHILCSADKKTGQIEALCGIPDCSHDGPACDAWLQLSGMGPIALTVSDQRVYVALEDISDFNKIIIRAFDLEKKTWSEVSELSYQDTGIRKNGYGNQNAQGFFHKDCFYYYTVRGKSVAGGLFGTKNIENTALLYQLPLAAPDQGKMLLEEEFPEQDNIWLNVTARGDSLIAVISGGLLTEYDEETYTAFYENEYSRISRCDLVTGELTTLYEDESMIGVSSLYPAEDALYIASYRTGEELLLRLDYDTKEFTEAASGLGGEYWAMYFNADGFYLLQKPSKFLQVDDLSCTFYDLKGQEQRSFSYRMPEELLPADLSAWSGWTMEAYDMVSIWACASASSTVTLTSVGMMLRSS